jgi:hypothetical protein
MQFERGLDPKEAIGIGLKAKAPVIGLLYKVEIEYDMNPNQAYVAERKTLSIVDSSEVFLILEGISQGRMPLDAFAFEQESDFSKTGERQPLEFFTEYKGKYLKYVSRGVSFRMSFDEYDHYNREYIFLIPQ